ncbi:prepilin-type N-terminal cleavage/methylation domain-containing protein [Candidatus Gottesmanbacteria bacterium]|nr:prepilin-type N-terminal cleavage/methylation domain-containing protein [Candidatus Gottesmanbacteria bacterium]
MKKGFTLIEVLVAATIIVVLASVAIASYSTASKNSRDAKRKADLANVAAALELYRADNSGAYILVSGAQRVDTGLTALEPTYINDLPVDPKPISSQAAGGYKYTNMLPPTAYKYCLFAVMENVSNGNGTTDGNNPCGYIHNSGNPSINYNYFIPNP